MCFHNWTYTGLGKGKFFLRAVHTIRCSFHWIKVSLTFCSAVSKDCKIDICAAPATNVLKSLGEKSSSLIWSSSQSSNREFFVFTSGAAASEEHSESSMVSGRMEALSLATTATRPLFWEKNTGRLAQQPPPRTQSPERTNTTVNDSFYLFIFFLDAWSTE